MKVIITLISISFLLATITQAESIHADIIKLVKEQEELEKKLIYSSKQLDFLKKLAVHEKVSFKLIKDLESFKGKELKDFISKYGFPDKTFVTHNLRHIEGGVVRWQYAVRENIVFELNLKQNEKSILIRNCYFFDLKNPSKTPLK